MAGRTYKYSKLAGESTEGIEDAVKTALASSGKTIRRHSWAHIIDLRANLNDDGSIDRWQVTLEAAFEVEEDRN